MRMESIFHVSTRSSDNGYQYNCLGCMQLLSWMLKAVEFSEEAIAQKQFSITKKLVCVWPKKNTELESQLMHQ